MRVNEIFYSLQGEGRWAGTPAVFIRFSGCNLKCPFCDTRHKHFKEMAEEEIVAKAAAYPARFAVLTGGEPSLAITLTLLEALHREGFFIQMETNGTVALDKATEDGIDWITCSPKFEFCHGGTLRIGRIDELKVVYTGQDMAVYACIQAMQNEYRLQPCDTGRSKKNKKLLKGAIAFIKAHPKWKLSLQTHKLVGIR